MPSPDEPHQGRRRPGWVPAAAAVLVGAGAAVLGTILHLNFTWIGGTSTADGAWILPWGAVLALLLTGSAQLWWTLKCSVPWAGGVLAISAFTTAMVLGNWPGLDTLAVAANEYTLAVVPGPAIAGTVWIWGIPLVAILTMLAAQPLLRHPVASD
ncbi:hypothetical protein [Microbacterium sp. A93]|uniref:hypothetical protein n=1 Tax=Microbacterium sp. A93 TaxID=3450716 RepID=UPI003F42908F